MHVTPEDEDENDQVTLSLSDSQFVEILEIWSQFCMWDAVNKGWNREDAMGFNQ